MEIYVILDLKRMNGLFTFGHKNVLIAASPYFRGKFESQNICKTGNDRVTISELKSTVLQILINYIYKGEIEVTKENVEDLLPAAKLVQLDFVYVTCIEFLQKKMDGSNCLSIRTIANNFNYPELLAISETFMKKQFLEVVKTEDFLLLSYDDLVGIIACNGLAVPCEEQSVEVYRPSDGVWSSVADMEISRFRLGVAVLDGLLYVMGGEMEEPVVYNTVEIYNPNSNTWTTEILSRNGERTYSGVVIDRPHHFL
ncbi:kelch-like protein 2 [Acyrthosiphon pisum]|uniref:BTB domain-containing protein n=1 Tax=Acyrthosiphon pisum TaxID=7029 RepID=A0A8R2NLD9_ACYPI|nr:kelch-like protein 2 [Acyrthosiphon pisum]|eukprot:XP_008187149.1 PREDICTED: kelch-like protein 2 [Acyrthosiphon pisum]